MKTLIGTILLLSATACGSRLVDFPIPPVEPSDSGSDANNVADVVSSDSNLFLSDVNCAPVFCPEGQICIRDITCSNLIPDASSNDSNTSDVINDTSTASDTSTGSNTSTGSDSNTTTCGADTFACGMFCAPNGSVCCGDGFCLPGKICTDNSTCTELVSDASSNDSNVSDVSTDTSTETSTDTGTDTGTVSDAAASSDASDSGTCHHQPCTNSCNTCTTGCGTSSHKTDYTIESYNNCVSNCNNNRDLCDKKYGNVECD